MDGSSNDSNTETIETKNIIADANGAKATTPSVTPNQPLALVSTTLASDQRSDQRERNTDANITPGSEGPSICWGSFGRSTLFDPFRRTSNLPFSIYVQNLLMVI